MDILLEKEDITITGTIAHGGIYKIPVIAQYILAAVMESDVTVMDTASEGGAWGMAILASYLKESDQLNLVEYLDRIVFKNIELTTIDLVDENIEQYKFYINQFVNALILKRDASRYL